MFFVRGKNIGGESKHGLPRGVWRKFIKIELRLAYIEISQFHFSFGVSSYKTIN